MRYLLAKHNREKFAIIPTVLLLALPLGGWVLPALFVVHAAEANDLNPQAEASHGVLTDEQGPAIPGKPVKVEHYVEPSSIEGRSSKTGGNPRRSDPDCGSSDTQNLVVQIATDHPGNKLTNFILQNSQALWAQVQEVPSSKLLEQNMTNQKAIIQEVNQNRTEMMSAADFVQLPIGSDPARIAARTCGEILRVMGGAPMTPGWPSMAELFPGEVGRSKALFNKAVESYLSTGHYLTEADDPTWGHQTLGNLARCVEPLAPFVAKEKAFKVSLQTLESQAKELRSQIQPEQKVTDQNVRQSAIYWLRSIRMTAKDF